MPVLRSPWWRVDFEKEIPIAVVRIWTRTDILDPDEWKAMNPLSPQEC